MGGMETYSKALAEEMEELMGVRRTVLPGNRDGSVPGAGALMWFGLRAAVKLLFTRHPADVTHVADMASWPLALCARLRRPTGRLILSAHGTDVSFALRGGVKAGVYRAYLRLGARLLGNATVIANSTATATCAARFGFCDTVVVPLAAQVTAPMPDMSHAGAILFAGRLLPLKGCAWFIRKVLPLLPAEIRLHVAGTIWDRDEEAALDAPNVRYLGVLDQTALRGGYAGALCVIVPNIELESGAFEGFGLVATEAAAAGGVVLASSHGGLGDAVLDGHTGFLLPPGNAEAWVDKIMDVARWSAAQRNSFVKTSQQLCAEQYSWHRVARQTKAVYEHKAADEAAGKTLI